MKKILLISTLIIAAISANSQVLLNEIYVDPNSGRQEFFELYNSSTSPVLESVDCFTLITYYEEPGNKKGWYVMNLPNISVGPKGFLVGAASNPFNVQGQTKAANFSWNNMPATGRLTKWLSNGTGYTSQTIPTNFNDFFTTVTGNGGKYVVLLFVNGVFVNGLIAGSSSNVLSANKASMPNLLVTTANAGTCFDFTVNFSTLGGIAMENVIAAGGTDNGYARSSDGKCGTWVKTSNAGDHTPGVTNGSGAGLTGGLTTAQLITCPSVVGDPAVVTYNITGVTGSTTEAADFPVEVQLYYDYGTIGTLDGADIYQSSMFDAAVSDPAKSFNVQQTQPVILVYKTKRGCFDKIVALENTCAPLSVNFKSFNARRDRSEVGISWETASEQNNSGFEVQRRIGNANYETLTFVGSKSADGNSESLLTYNYNDLNPTRGMSHYRIRQVDFDGKASFSEIRAVRGESQSGKTIVYPNPASNGVVNVVFEDVSITRDVTLMDMSGRIMRQWNNVTQNNIRVDNLRTGIYGLRVMDRETGELSFEKIIVK
jgi:hypothetical protein